MQLQLQSLHQVPVAGLQVQVQVQVQHAVEVLGTRRYRCAVVFGSSPRRAPAAVWGSRAHCSVRLGSVMSGVTWTEVGLADFKLTASDL